MERDTFPSTEFLDASNLPIEVIEDIRSLIRSDLNKANIHEAICESLRVIDRPTDAPPTNGNIPDNSYHQSNADNQNPDLKHIMYPLKSKGIIDEIKQNVVHTLHLKSSSSKSFDYTSIRTPVSVPMDYGSGLQSKISSGSVFLRLDVHEGRAFVDYLLDESESTLSLHLSFKNQRFHSCVFECVSNPKIGDVFYLELVPGSYGDSSLLGISENIHLVLLRHNKLNSDCQLLSSTFFDWRLVLCDEKLKVHRSIRLNGVGAEAQVSAGILDITTSIVTSATRPVDRFSRELIMQQLKLEQQRSEERERIFLLYSEQWWLEYVQARPGNDRRLVKIFARTECGLNKFVCELLRPIKAGRIIESPRQAARFVSMIPYEKISALGVGHGVPEMWCSLHAMLSRNRGDSGDHALLLCSLLLGFGLDAYVAFGSKSEASTVAWVVTLSGSSQDSVHFWDPVTGRRYLHKQYQQENFPINIPKKPQYPYERIGCLFNHCSFYGNNQATDNVDLCNFNIRKQALWKPMSEQAIQTLVSGSSGKLTTISAPLLNAISCSNQLEYELRLILVEKRKELGMSTSWDDDLSCALSQALSSYETERLLDVSVGNEEFQASIHNLVPEGHTFKAYPLQVLHLDARRAFASAMKSPVCQEIVGCRGDQVYMALRVRVYSYAENATAAWIMLACKYQSSL